MSKNVANKGASNKSGAPKKAVEYVVHKSQSEHWAVKEQSAGSERFAEAVQRVASKRRKMSEYTREEADWLNSLVHSAAKGVIDKE